jgi:threonine/homoserine/homoserine lactone efflux protein
MGVATAALIWAATAAAGLALLLASIGGLDVLLRVTGATVLIVFGARLLSAAAR